MSDTDSMTEVVVEEATNQLDVEGLVGGDSLDEQVDSAAVGRAVGSRLGEAAGQRIGAAVGRRVQEALANRDEAAGPRDLAAELSAAVSDGLRDALSESRDSGSALATIVDAVTDAGLGSQLADAIGSATDDTSAETDDTSGGTDDAPAEDESAGETDTEEDESAGETDTEEDESAGGTDTEEAEETASIDAVDELDAADVDAADLDSLKAETLESYLDSISYRDLQSIAKEVGVTANLTHEEMADRIVDAVTDDGDES